MKRLLTLLALATGAILFLFVPSVAAADGSSTDISGIETSLLAFAPIATFLTSLVLGPGAGEAVKKAVPAAVTIIVSVVWFFAQNMPEFTAEMAVSIGLLGTLVNRVYEWVNAALQLAFGRSLNDITGSGLIGREV